MSTAYRDDEGPLRERIEQLNAEQQTLRERARELRDAEARVAEIAREIEETQKRLDDLRGPAMDLERLRIASPCKASWDEMQGDERVRFCGHCQKNVYNLSGMRRDEATALVRERTGEICVRMYRRNDGTVLTTDCPVGARKKNVRRLVVLAAGGGALAMAGATLYSQTTMGGAHVAGGLEAIPPERVVVVQGEPQPPTMGTVSVPSEPPPQVMMGAPMPQRLEPARPVESSTAPSPKGPPKRLPPPAGRGAGTPGAPPG